MYTMQIITELPQKGCNVMEFISTIISNITTADWINISLSIMMLILTIAMFRLNKTMTEISKSEYNAKHGSDLMVTLPTLTFKESSTKQKLKNLAVVNNKNKTENIYRVFFIQNDIEITFWFAGAEGKPLIIPPYESRVITCNISSDKDSMEDISKCKFFAITNDSKVEMPIHLNCYSKE